MSTSQSQDTGNVLYSTGSDHYDLESLDNIPQPQSVGIEDSTPKGSRVWYPDGPVKPTVGAIFQSLDQVEHFYREYAKKGGFEVRIGGGYEPIKGKPLSKYFYCSREGYKPTIGTDNSNRYNKINLKDISDELNEDSVLTKDSDKKQKRRRPSIRCGCPAFLLVKLDGNRYIVTKFNEKHNHSLVKEDDVQFLRAYRQLTFPQKQLLHQLSHANLGPVKGFKILKQIYGGFANVGATVNDCKIFRSDMQKFIGDRDAQMVVEKLLSKRDFNKGFSMDYLTDNSNKLTGLFWADEDSKRSYFTFGDVISFDATFDSNKYKMVFVPFTGIDNHNRCVTFGAGLISKEDIGSYSWLLQVFLKAFGRKPKVVVTDQDPALKIAIEEVFPDVRHRLCMWHIMQKLSVKVATHVFNNKSFKERICNIVWTDRIDPDVFEHKWQSVMDDFNLHDNTWLSEMFALRSKWIPAYYREEPLSGLMRITSRSESENHLFGQLTNANLTLVEFLSHFETAMDVQRYNHSKHDHESRYTTPDFKTKLEIERDAARIYTRTIFYDVQDEMEHALLYCDSYNVTDIGDQKLVEVKERKPDTINDGNEANDDNEEMPTDEKLPTYQVMFRASDVTVSCTCNRYESYGLLCRHAFLVLRMFNIKKFPRKYVLRRWTREALPPRSEESINKVQQLAEASPEANSIIRGIYYSVEYTVNRLVGDMDKLSLYGDTLKQLMMKADSDVPIPKKPTKNEMMSSMLGVTEPAEVNVENPNIASNKGCRSSKRIKSSKEQSMTEKTRKLRTCGNCGKQEGHNVKTCPHKDVASTS